MLLMPAKKITQKKYTKLRLKAFLKSIWLFPAILTLILIVLSCLQISGSSIGVYHDIFYGNTHDEDLIVNTAKYIRSDEWIVSSQKTIAQKNNNFDIINTNTGNGEDTAVLYDTPYKDWSLLFKPQNIGYLALPFDVAFALHWWIMAYFLVLSCYFFILMILPNKKMLAIMLSLAILFSPMVQWWYQYSTMASIYYCLFGAIVLLKILRSKRRSHALGWSAILAYIATCFVLVLYPPFQITCALVTLIFIVAYAIEQRHTFKNINLRRNLLFMVIGLVLAGVIVGVFINQHKETVATIQNTSYPGKRIVQSGGYDLEHLLSSQLSPLFQSSSRSSGYGYSSQSIGLTNQSETSTFILLIPFLLLPIMFLGYKKYRKEKKIDYIVVASVATTLLLFSWMFIPGLDILGKITLLDKVPVVRSLVGWGVLNLIMIIAFIRLYQNYSKRFTIGQSSAYSLLVVIACLLINFHIMVQFPSFIDYKFAVVLALPLATIVFLLLRKHFILASFVFLTFSIASTCLINPLYKGTEIITQTPISKAIREIGDNDKKWVSEDFHIENFATMSGQPSLTGVYSYPQLVIWKNITTPDAENIYNRYAHVNFVFYRDSKQYVKPKLTLIQGDRFNVEIEPCDAFLKQNNVGFLITSTKFEHGEAKCATLIKTVVYPKLDYFIYKLTF